MVHPVEGFEPCLDCHGLAGPVPFPANHQDFTLETCQVCHAMDEPRTAPGFIQHSTVKREECDRCHEPNLLPPNHQVAEFSNQECLWCHLAEQVNDGG